MGRLIDADKLETTAVFRLQLQHAMSRYYYFYEEETIQKAPTVIAIPIDWIHDYLNETFLPESHFWVIQKMIKRWDEEHEKDI